MEYRRYGDTLVIRLDPGDEVVQSLKDIIRESSVQQGSVSGIGAVSSATLGVYDLETHIYHQETYEGVYEIVSLLGNVTRQGDEPYLHLHMTVAGPDNRAVGGHLNAAVISATAEIYIHILVDADIDRRHDEFTGLNLLEFR